MRPLSYHTPIGMRREPDSLILRRLVVAAPLATAAILITHAAEPTNSWWLVMHVILLPLFAASALAVCMLTDGIPGPLPLVTRVAMGVFTVFYTALDSIFGVAQGILASHPNTFGAAERMTSHPVARGIAVVAVTAGLIGVLAAAFALFRAGMPRLPVLLLVPAAYALTEKHSSPAGPVAFALIFVVAVWVEASRVRGPAGA